MHPDYISCCSEGLFQPLKRYKVEGLPLSFAQERMWFLHQLVPDSAVYNVPVGFRFSGPLDVAVLARSVQEVIRRHEILRTNYSQVNGQPLQIIADTSPFSLRQIDLRRFQPHDAEVEAVRIATEEACQPFDLANGPVMNGTVFLLDTQKYLLLLVFHHVVWDAWTRGIFLKELSGLYNAFAASRPSPLPDPEYQYSDYSLWQRQTLQDDALRGQLEYWKDQMRNAPSVLKFPSKKHVRAAAGYHGTIVKRKLSQALISALQQLGNEQGTTSFITSLSAFYALLYRYSGDEDIVVGTPFSGRTHEEFKTLIGCFINVLPIRINLSENPSFREVLQRVRKTVVGALANQDLPLEKLVEELRPGRALVQTPLFQALFNVKTFPDQTLQIAEVRTAEVEFDTGTTPVPITFELVRKSEGFFLSCCLNTDQFEPEMAERMIGHYLTLLESAVANPDCKISTLPLLSQKEIRQVSVEWNDTKRIFSGPHSVPQWIEKQARLSPERTAVVCETQQLTYGQLNKSANQLARFLKKMGIEPDQRVGICLEPSLEMVVSILAVLKSGGAYVPIDPDYPKERMTFLLADACISVLLTQQEFFKELQSHHPNLVSVEKFLAESGESAENPGVEIQDEHLAYVIYTSGSTGKPNGVMISHGALLNHLAWMYETFPLQAQDVILQRTPFSFDASVWEFFVPLMAGARLVVASQWGEKDPAYLAQTIIRQKVTVVEFVPALLNLFLDQKELKNCNSLRRVFCGGEALSLELVKKFFNRLDAELLNMYGPTEATIGATSWAFDAKKDGEIVPIGRPIANTQIYILDSYFQHVPIGVAGQICIGGAGLARGYLNRPELTSQRFITRDSISGRIYCTGDLGRYLEDGNLEFLGRIDHQINLRGYRIEPVEIESVLSQHRDVSECVIAYRQDTLAEKHLTAFVVFKDENTPSANELRAFLAERLPAYMIPSKFVTLPKLPRTPNGKMDREALPIPDHEDIQSGEDPLYPRTLLQAKIAAIWSEVLSLTQISVHDDFFALGGDSLSAIRVIVRLSEFLEKTLPVRAIFDASTIEGLARKIKEEFE